MNVLAKGQIFVEKRDMNFKTFFLDGISEVYRKTVIEYSLIKSFGVGNDNLPKAFSNIIASNIVRHYLFFQFSPFVF